MLCEIAFLLLWHTLSEKHSGAASAWVKGTELYLKIALWHLAVVLIKVDDELVITLFLPEPRELVIPVASDFYFYLDTSTSQRPICAGFK